MILSITVLSCNNHSKNNSKDGNNHTGVSIQITKEKPKFSEKSIELNKRAVNYINERYYESYQKALNLLNIAIQNDTNYFMAYANKGVVYTKLGRYNDAIKTYVYLTSNIKKDYPEGLTFLGMLYEKIGNDKLARKAYSKAIQEYSVRIEKSNDLLDCVNKAHIVFIIDKNKGIREIDSLIKQYPSAKELLMYKEYLFLNYNHEEVLSNL